MPTVPRTAFDADAEEYKLVLNLLDAATNAIRRGNRLRAMCCMAETKSIMRKWPQSSLAGHMFKRVNAIMDALNRG